MDHIRSNPADQPVEFEERARVLNAGARIGETPIEETERDAVNRQAGTGVELRSAGDLVGNHMDVTPVESTVELPEPTSAAADFRGEDFREDENRHRSPPAADAIRPPGFAVTT